ncbi:MAG: tRNA (adenosine(37)-N6)-threonylcarbamoyltransferase complex dimerization subunit type 1 TsaB [Methylococcaceae bacterium]|nr:MAG: tRNA (adenosine(37)-N6)-threonylcarbamoyltransferase complex dimerization subunit type 1 TsaB [Methylococcaceae bacterium]
MKILALDTATEACSAALFVDGQVLERYRLAPREHTALILPMLDELLAESGFSIKEMDGLGFGRGPGAFTGVRIAAGVAQGIAFGVDLPVVPVSTLAALALQVFDETALDYAFPCIDARMGEVYWGTFQRGRYNLPEPCQNECVCPPESVTYPRAGAGVALGSGWAGYGGLLQQSADGRVTAAWTDRYPRAGAVARLAADGFARGQQVQADSALPVYLRDKVAKKPAHA